jgi:lipopolysaccharide transport system ATP-binding protein
MSDIAISAEKLGKRYSLDHQSEGGRKYVALRDVATNLARSGYRRMTGLVRGDRSESKRKRKEDFWALRDISFELKKGDRLGVIGPNGAGKSTLLKLLSRITEPTTGRFRLEGRVASLLEVGTGFHPELTGRENIYLNGAILGMAKNEIRKNFDAIVEFADVERFLDTPVKRYSSGMYVRLAFSVSAHLEPEILIVDEVLAVGDAAFQKKCLGRMEDVGKSGRTVLFVSHNMPMIKQLCNRGLVLSQGKVAFSGSTSDAIAEYEHGLQFNSSGLWTNESLSEQNKSAYIKSIEILDANGHRSDAILNTDPICIRFCCVVNSPDRYLKIGFDLARSSGIVFRCEHVDSPTPIGHLGEGMHVLFAKIPGGFLNPGRYYLVPQISIHCVVGLRASQEPVLMFDVAINPGTNEFHAVLNEQNHPGAVFPLLQWGRESK